MDAYKLLIKPSAAKELERIDSKADRLRIVSRIRALAAQPRPNGSEKLAGFDDRFRIRQGHFRIIYLIDDGARDVPIYKIGRRRDVYR